MSNTEEEKITIKESVSIINKILAFWSKYHKQLTVGIALLSGYLGYNGESIVSKIDEITKSFTTNSTNGLSDRVSDLEKSTKENTDLIKIILEEVKKK